MGHWRILSRTLEASAIRDEPLANFPNHEPESVGADCDVATLIPTPSAHNVTD